MSASSWQQLPIAETKEKQVPEPAWILLHIKHAKSTFSWTCVSVKIISGPSVRLNITFETRHALMDRTLPATYHLSVHKTNCVILKQRTGVLKTGPTYQDSVIYASFVMFRLTLWVSPAAQDVLTMVPIHPDRYFMHDKMCYPHFQHICVYILTFFFPDEMCI